VKGTSLEIDWDERNHTVFLDDDGSRLCMQKSDRLHCRLGSHDRMQIQIESFEAKAVSLSVREGNPIKSIG
jgi:hypothetical protein